jgi:hypothetical protein
MRWLRSENLARVSVLFEVTLLLERVVAGGVGRPFGAADSEVRVGEHGAERARQNLVAASASSASACDCGRRGGLVVSRQRRRVDVERLGRLEPPLDTIEARRDQAAERQYGLQLASHAFSSTLVDASSAATKTDATRTGASRLS